MPNAILDCAATLLVCIDMQRLFLEPGDWFCPIGLSILPQVERLASQTGATCCFTRFITPVTAADAPGRWQHYYNHWQSVTQAEIGPAAMDLHPALAQIPGPVVDKTTYNAFASDAFTAIIDQKKPQTLVLFGIETDVCILATALSAVDRGLNVVIAEDAVASADSASHNACINLVYPRMDQQIEIASSTEIIAVLRKH